MQTLIFRYTINEDKLLAKLEANKRKPMKKSGFMKRLEEAQRAQQETLRNNKRLRKNDRIIVIVVLEKGPFICLLVDKGTFLYILARLLEKQDVLIMILFVYLYLFKTFCLFALFCIQKIDEEIDFFYIEEIGRL